MPHLTISALGSFQICLDGSPVIGLESDKGRALLVYLAVEAGRPHRRERLAGLFWPEMPERQARKNLRQAVYNLRQSLGDTDTSPAPFLLVTPQEVQFNLHSDRSLDVAEFAALRAACQSHAHGRIEECPACIERLRRAVELYQGEFMAGLSLANAPDFEEWALLKREELQGLALDALDILSHHQEDHGFYSLAIPYVRRALELEPWREVTHQQLMRLLALTGRQDAALHQYARLRRTLEQEFQATPMQETAALYRRIRAGALQGNAAAPADLHEGLWSTPHTPDPAPISPEPPPEPLAAPCDIIIPQDRLPSPGATETPVTKKAQVPDQNRRVRLSRPRWTQGVLPWHRTPQPPPPVRDDCVDEFLLPWGGRSRQPDDVAAPSSDPRPQEAGPLPAYISPEGRDLRIDLLRGYFVVAMIVDHVRGASPLYLLTGGNRFFTSAAEGFILTSGLVAGLVYRRLIGRDGIGPSLQKVLARSLTLYLLTIGLTLALLPALGGAVPPLGAGGGSVQTPGLRDQHPHPAPHLLPGRRHATVYRVVHHDADGAIAHGARQDQVSIGCIMAVVGFAPGLPGVCRGHLAHRGELSLYLLRLATALLQRPGAGLQSRSPAALELRRRAPAARRAGRAP